MATDKQCGFDGCDRKRVAKGLCSGHYQQRKRGNVLHPLRQLDSPSDSLAARFWSRVDTSAGPDRCWLWTARLQPNGYGQLQVRPKARYAHRLAYELLVGTIPEGAFVDHTCWVRHCVNPDHLRLVTHSQNHENRAGASAASSTGVRGVYTDARSGKYLAQVDSRGIRYHGGFFESLADAEAAVKALRCQVMTHNDADRRSTLKEPNHG